MRMKLLPISSGITATYRDTITAPAFIQLAVDPTPEESDNIHFHIEDQAGIPQTETVGIVYCDGIPVLTIACLCNPEMGRANLYLRGTDSGKDRASLQTDPMTFKYILDFVQAFNSVHQGPPALTGLVDPRFTAYYKAGTEPKKKKEVREKVVGPAPLQEIANQWLKG